MKHIIILGDGMADEACDALGGKTPLEAADTPAMDELARRERPDFLPLCPKGIPRGAR